MTLLTLKLLFKLLLSLSRPDLEQVVGLVDHSQVFINDLNNYRIELLVQRIGAAALDHHQFYT